MGTPTSLHVELLSDTTIGRGEGTAGEVDVEVDHDQLGLPVMGGKAIRGLLRDTWLSMLNAFSGRLEDDARVVLGPPADLDEVGILRIGDASVGADVTRWVEWAIRRGEHGVSPDRIRDALTTIRRQTAQSRQTGAPDVVTLRASRVVSKGLTLVAPLCWLAEPSESQVEVLALCALGTRHVGLGRTRGRGHVRMTLDGDLTATRARAGVARGAR